MSYRWSEEDVAQHLGITRRELKRLKKDRLAPIEHYEVVDGEQRLNDDGLMALCAFAQVDPPLGMDPAKKTPRAPTGEPALVAFVVERMCPNPTWVLGRRLGDDGPVGDRERCRVRNNQYLRFRQKIAVVRLGDHYQEVRVKA